MTKYYVQSGNLRMVMVAADTQAAALWLVHRALHLILPAYDDRSLTTQDRLEIAMSHGLMQLDLTVQIDERGFDRPDSMKLDSSKLILDWHQLMSALIRLESELC